MDPPSGDTASGNSGLFRGSCDVVAWEPLSDVAAACDDDDDEDDDEWEDSYTEISMTDATETETQLDQPAKEVLPTPKATSISPSRKRKEASKQGKK